MTYVIDGDPHTPFDDLHEAVAYAEQHIPDAGWVHITPTPEVEATS